MALTRREFIKVLGAGSAAGLIGGCGNNAAPHVVTAQK
jgi:sulfur-oxidizing protein SoxB